MSRVVEIKPVTRIEGHAKIKIWLNEEGEVEDAHFHVLEVRGFERFLIGRPIEELPLITPRICGICYTCHHLASAKAVDACFGLRPEDLPEAANMLRELLHMAGFIHSHILHFYLLAAPDLVLGPGADPRERNFMGLLKAMPDTVKEVIKARAIGQKMGEVVGGRAIHPVAAVPGGFSKPLSREDRDRLLQDLKWLLGFAKSTVELCEGLMEKHADLVREVGVLRTYHLGMVSEGGVHNLYHGRLRFIDPDGNVAAEFPYEKYLDFIAERVMDYSYLKFPYFKPAGWPKGIYRVNTLSRLNVADRMATPIAQEALERLRSKWGRPAHNALLFNLARCIELVAATERAIELLEDDKILSSNLRLPVKPREGEGIGVVEAHRGVLIHHYACDDRGITTDANLIVATVQNNPAFDLHVKEEAKRFIKRGEVREELLNKIEMVIRAYDPCLSCATHIMAERPELRIEVYDHRGELVKVLE